MILDFTVAQITDFLYYNDDLREHHLKGVLPTFINSGRGPELEGAVVALFHLLFSWNDKGRALREAFWRDRLPNIMNLLATTVVFGAVIYLQGFRLEIPVKSNRFRGQRGSYPVKLFYTSNMPIMLQSALTSHIFLVSQMLFSRFPDSILIKILGVWEPLEDSPQLVTTQGITYYLSAPRMMRSAITDPIHMLVYVTFIVSLCALFSKTWIEVSGSGPRDVAKQLKDQQMVMATVRVQCIRSSSASSRRLLQSVALFSASSPSSRSARVALEVVEAPRNLTAKTKL